jgi:hypothetical protein
MRLRREPLADLPECVGGRDNLTTHPSRHRRLAPKLFLFFGLSALPGAKVVIAKDLRVKSSF